MEPTAFKTTLNFLNTRFTCLISPSSGGDKIHSSTTGDWHFKYGNRKEKDSR